jgi:hypothetical protein
MTEFREQFWPGQSAPDFLMPGTPGTRVTFYEQHCGRPTVLVFVTSAGDAPELADLQARAHVLVIVSAISDTPVPSDAICLVDDGRITNAFLGRPAVAKPVVLVLRATLAVEARLEAPGVAEIGRVLDTLLPEPEHLCSGIAPVLMVPNALPPGLCQRLISAHDADHHDSGMLREVDGKVELVPDPRTKKRRDHRLTDPELVEAVTEALRDRLLPAIARAFHYSVTQMENYKVVAYDSATGGYFRPHRDNSTPDARHRRFALSLNLNTGYAGGELVFPEFGACQYRPPAGGAVVFSGTHLHAARDVTAGRRYVLLTFLW